MNEEQLKKYVRAYFKEIGVQDKVLQMILELHEESDNTTIRKEVVSKLKHGGLLKSVVKEVRSRIGAQPSTEDFKSCDTKRLRPDEDCVVSSISSQESSDLPQSVPYEHQEDSYKTFKDDPVVDRVLNPKRRHLHLEITRGRGFLDHLLVESSMFLLFVHYRKQRFWTRPVPCWGDPEFKAGFLMELHTDESGPFRMADEYDLLRLSEPIHLVLVKILPSGDKHLISSFLMEWRHILSASNSRSASFLELHGVGAESLVCIGQLGVRLSLIPALAQPLPNHSISAQLEREQSMQQGKDTVFFMYAKHWWKEYLDLRSDHSQRLVKIFSQDENSRLRPVFHYVKPLEVGRPLLETPREAAWFVSLIELEMPALMGSLPSIEQWWNTHTFLCMKKGSLENHAFLLCSLLLGFGLDAYVCVGTKNQVVPWMWVLTVGRQHNCAIFWESTTGARYSHVNPTSSQSAMPDENITYPYSKIGCVFNDKCFYANIQETDSVKLCRFDLENLRLWKPMSAGAINSMGMERTVPLLPGWSDPIMYSQDIERGLRGLIFDYRLDFLLSTHWNIDLCRLLAPVLTSYEMEHKCGVKLAQEEVRELVVAATPRGFMLRAVPIHLPAKNSRFLFRVCLRNDEIKQILHCTEVDAQFAIRVHAYI